MKFDFHELKEFTPELINQFHKVIDIGLKAINSDEFQDKVVNFKWTETYWSWFRRKSIEHNTYYQNNGKSNQQIYDMLMSGTDNIHPLPDGDMDLYLELYYANNGVIGYTSGGTETIFINRKFFIPNLGTPRGNADIVANLVHEYMHKVGFDHSYFNSSVRPYSVPYAVGYLAGDVTYNLIKKTSSGGEA